MRDEIEHALGIDLVAEVVGDEHLPSCFAVSDLLSASVAAVGSAASSLFEAVGCGSASKRDPVADRISVSNLWRNCETSGYDRRRS